MGYWRTAAAGPMIQHGHNFIRICISKDLYLYKTREPTIVYV